MSQIIRKKKKYNEKMPVRMWIVLELKAIIDRCRALTKNRIKKTIFMVFNEKTTLELGATMRELATAFEGNDSTDSIIKMRRRLQIYRKYVDQKSIVPYPLRTMEGIYLHFNHQTKQEYKQIQKRRADVNRGNDKIDQEMLSRLSKTKAQREQTARAEQAEIEYQIAKDKKKRKKGNP
jgi:hypothetical protein